MRRPRAILLGLLIFAIGTAIATPFIGMQAVPFESILHPTGDDSESFIFWKIRMPRVALALLAGAALAVSGMTFQAIFRNPLATPFTLGVSSGASLGVAVSVRLGFSYSILGIPSLNGFAFAGALVAILIVYGVTQLREGFTTTTMLLAGVAISFFFSSLILFIQYTADINNSFRILRWLMGGLNSVTGFGDFYTAVPFVAIGIIILAAYTHELNLLAIGDDIAMSRGVDVRRTKRILFIVTSLMVGAVVAVCGPIAFVGMMAPHICRMLIGPDHRYLMPASCLFGAAFLALCDTIARTVIAPTQLPVGILTAFLGGPFFLWLLVSGRATSGNRA